MPCDNIINWTTIRKMCRNRYTERTSEEVEVRATALARMYVEEEVGAFEREGVVAKQAMEKVVNEATGKDVEQTFGVLQSRWAIVRYPSRTWIVEAEWDDNIYGQGRDFQGELVDPAPGVASWDQFMHTTKTLHDRDIHDRLQTDLIEHIWALAGNQHG
jgi:hypothetical protein